MMDTYLTTLPNRSVIAISGADSHTFLQRVITNGPEGLKDDQAMVSALLTPQGKVLADFILFDGGQEGLYVDAPTSEVEGLLKRFSLYRMRAEATISAREDLAVITGRGDRVEELKAVALAAAPDPRNPDIGWRAIAPAGGPDAELNAYHQHRIKAGVAEFGSDYGPADVFSTDVNHDLMGGLDYKKGCFVGQEVASRMYRKGGVRKRTICLSAEQPLQPGATVTVGDVKLGVVTSVAEGLGLARVRIDRLRDGLANDQALSADETPVSWVGDLDAY